MDNKVVRLGYFIDFIVTLTFMVARSCRGVLKGGSCETSKLKAESCRSNLVLALPVTR